MRLKYEAIAAGRNGRQVLQELLKALGAPQEA
jgi:hypothetical protein